MGRTLEAGMTSAGSGFVLGAVQVGFPSPAQDYLMDTIDLNRELVRHPASTFFARVTGDSMCGEGIEDGDLVVVDRSIEAEDGDLCVCCLDGGFTLKRLRIEATRVLLVPSNRRYAPIEVGADSGRDFRVWGVVTHTIKENRRRRR